MLFIYTDRHNTDDTGVLRPLDNLVKFPGEAVIIEMTMAVEQVHFFPLDRLDGYVGLDR